jgi:SAM-dependent methyltransferase
MLFNCILDDAARVRHTLAEKILWACCPEMMQRKFPRANVQQAFVFDAVRRFTPFPGPILCAGCHEDTAFAAFQALEYNVTGIDPEVNGIDLRAFTERHLQSQAPLFAAVFSTSVIEHVPDDVQFLRDMMSLTRPGGVLILTTDFHAMGPHGGMRFYTEADLKRLAGLIESSGWSLLDQPCWSNAVPDFALLGLTYSFATFGARRGST